MVVSPPQLCGVTPLICVGLRAVMAVASQGREVGGAEAPTWVEASSAIWVSLRLPSAVEVRPLICVVVTALELRGV